MPVEHPVNDSMSMISPKIPGSESLPAEILSHIFWFIPRLSDNIHTPVPPWAVVLQVCHKWRTISMNFADLWTIIPLGNIHWTERALHLSQPRPIVIHFPEPSSRRPRQPILKAMEHAERAISLSISTSQSSFEHPFGAGVLRVLGEHPPRDLVEFALSGVNYHHQGDLFFHENVRLALSRIRHLRLTSCILPTNELVLPQTLVSLYIHGAVFGNWSLSNIIDLLAHLPALEELALLELRLFYDPNVPHPPKDITQVARLPHIRSLSIDDYADVVLFYMRSLDIPLHPELHLDIVCSAMPLGPRLVDPSKQFAIELFSILAQHLHAAATRYPLKISVSTKSHRSSVHCEVANMRIVTAEQLPDPTILPTLFPVAACEASVQCEDRVIPLMIWLAILERTSPYLQRIVISDLSHLSTFPPAQVGYEDLSTPHLREIVMTGHDHKYRDINREQHPFKFSDLLRLLRNTTATVVLGSGVLFEKDEMVALQSFGGRVDISSDLR